MKDILENKGKLIGIFSVIIIIITAASVFWTYRTIDTNIDLEDLENADLQEEIQEEVEEVIEPKFNKADKMRGVVISPGLDFLKSSSNSQEEIEKQVDEIIEQAKKYQFNSIIINTYYKDGEEDKVIYSSPNAETFNIQSEEAENEVDIYNLVAKKAQSEGLYTYALIDIAAYKNTIDKQFTVDTYETSVETSDLYVNVKDFTEKYQPDGVLITGYQTAITQEKKEEFAEVGGEVSLEEYLVIATELNLKAVSKAVKDVSIDVQFGILADQVWQNKEDNPKGSRTKAEETALSSYYADTQSMITNDLFDFIIVNTNTKIEDKISDFTEVIHWWDKTAGETKAPIYIMMAASNVGSGYDNTELAKQAKIIDGATQLQGSVFDGLSFLIEKQESSKNLKSYYVDGEEVEGADSGGEKTDGATTSEKPPAEKLAITETPLTVPKTEQQPSVTTDAETIKLNTTALTLRAGETKQLTATVAPETLSQEATWGSENREIAKVDGNGNVIAVAKGEVNIKATSVGGKVTSCKITVTEAKESTDGENNTVPVTEIVVSPQTATVGEGKTQQLTVEVKPENATNKNVTWGSGDAKIATVDTTGKVTGVAKGETTITAMSVDGKKTANCKITVTSDGESDPSKPTGSTSLKDVTTITLSASSSNMYIKSSQTMIVKDQNGKTLANSLFKWETSNREAARVDAGGIVTGKSKAGAATISAYNEEYSLYGTYQVTITEERVRVTAIELNTSAISVAVGKTNGSVKATLQPSNATASDITWRVSNSEIASVDSYGVVTGKAVGTTTLIAKSEKVQANCRIEVTSKVEIEDVYIDDSDFEMKVGATDQLSAIVDPKGVDFKFIWKSSSPTVLEIDNSGNITAKSAGKATITVKVEGNDKYYDSITITVV